MSATGRTHRTRALRQPEKEGDTQNKKGNQKKERENAVEIVILPLLERSSSNERKEIERQIERKH